MKVKSLSVKNVGLLKDETIPFEKPLILFYGEIQQGKSTLLNAIRWLLGAEVPSDLIRHGEKEAEITLTLDCGVISRSWYLGKKGMTGRDLVFMRDGRMIDRPAGEIARLLNPFTLDQNFLVKMGETARKRYFAELFAVDTVALDQEAVRVSQEATRLRTEISGYGDIDLTPVPESNIAQLRKDLAEIRRASDAERAEIDNLNRTAAEKNRTHDSAVSHIKEYDRLILRAKAELEQLIKSRDDAALLLQNNPQIALKPYPAQPDTQDLEERIQKAAADDVRREQLKRNQARAEEKAGKEKLLREKEQRSRAIRDEKIAKLKAITENSKIPGLSFDEEGNFAYHGTQAGMLSTSQLMKLSSELSSLYPKGLCLELIDRAESLGRSIFEFITKAEKDGSTILATIVGDAPAKTPEGVGVFVVDQGKVTEKQPELV